MEILEDKSNKLLEVTNNVLTQTLGENATFLIFQYIQALSVSNSKDYSTRINLVSKVLRDCLGSGAVPIEHKILSELYGIR